MFEFVRNNSRWLMAVILALTAVAFLAPQGYSSFMDATSTGVATVAGQKITQAEWDAAHRQNVERVLRERPGLDAKLLDTPEVRSQSLDGVVQQRLLAAAAFAQHLEVGNERLEGRFARDPELAFLRDANGGVNKVALAAQGMSKEMFIERLRSDLRLRQVMAAVGQPATQAKVAAALAFDALLQRRELRVQFFDPQAYVGQVQLSDADVASYYALPDTQKRWTRPESAQIEYLLLDAEQLKAGLKVEEGELRKLYDDNAARYQTAEERRASHILLKTEGQDEKLVLAKAEQLLAEVKKEPAKFAELARKNSQDEGSAAAGGDLDFFGRGAMVKAFDDAVFAMKVGDIAGPVKSEFGYHLIKLDAVRGGERRPFEAVRAEIETEALAQKARQRYQGLAEQFTALVFEQPDSLQPAAEKLGLTIQKADVQRQPQAGQQGVLASAKLLDAVFGVEALRNKRNTEALEVAPNQLVSARIVTHRPAAAPALAEVKDAVRAQLQLQRAAELAKKAGEARVAQTASDDGLGDALWISRPAPGQLPQAVVEAALRADAAKLPLLSGVDQGAAGYWVFKLLQVGGRQPDVVPEEMASRQFAQAWAQAESRAYVEALKLSNKAKITAPKPASAP